eukprot:ANDGO_05475.mRNA.1 Sister chromatid cohesion protein pds5
MPQSETSVPQLVNEIHGKLFPTDAKTQPESPSAAYFGSLVHSRILGSSAVSAECRAKSFVVLAEIFRLSAPSVPSFENDAHAMSAFRLFAVELTHIQQEDSPYFELYFSGLEKLALSKCFSHVFEALHSLFQELVEAVLESANPGSSGKIEQYLADLLTALFEKYTDDGEDMDTVFASILEKLIAFKDKDGNIVFPGAYGVVSRMLLSCSDVLQHPISRIISDSVVKGSSSIKLFKERKTLHEIIFQLNQISSNLLLFALPSIAQGLDVEADDARLATVTLLCRMFSSEKSTLFSEYEGMFQALLSRFTDRAGHIRLALTHFSKVMLLHHPTSAAALNSHLRNRTLDVEDGVRRAVVSTVLSVAQQDLSLIDEVVLREVGSRCHDKKHAVRSVAVDGLVALYKQYIRRVVSKSLPAAECKKLSWIPDVLLAAYMSMDEELRMTSERLLDSILSFGESMEERAILFIHLISNLSAAGMQIFKTMLDTKKKSSEHLSTIVQLNQQGLDFTNEKVRRHVDALAGMFPSSSRSMISDIVVKIYAQCRSTKFAGRILSITQPVTEHDEMVDHIKSLLKSTKDLSLSDDHVPWYHFLVRRCSYASICSSVLEAVASLAIASPDPTAGSASLIILNMIADRFPLALGNCMSSLAQVVTESKGETAAESAMRVLSKCGAGLESSNPSLYRTLRSKFESFCISSRPRLSKYSVRLASIGATNPDVLLSSLSRKLQDNCREGAYLGAVLSGVSEMQKVSKFVFDNMQEDVLTFITSVVLSSSVPKNLPDSVSIEQPNSFCVTKKYGLKILSRHLTKTFDGALFEDFAKFVNAVFDRKFSVPGHTSQVALEYFSGRSVLRLLAEPTTEAHVPLSLFYSCTRSVLLNEDSQVRLMFLSKAYALVRQQRLPVKYFSLFVIGCIDPDASVAERSRECLRDVLSVFFHIVQQHSVTMNKGFAYTIMPEYAIPPLVHILAHVTEDVDYNLVARCLQVYLEELFADGRGSGTLAAQLFQSLKAYDDTMSPNSDRCREICDIGSLVLQQVSEGRVFTITDLSGKIQIIPKMFSAAADRRKASKTYVPSNFQVPKRTVSHGKSRELVMPSSPFGPKAGVATSPETPATSSSARKNSRSSSERKRARSSTSSRKSKRRVRRTTYDDDDDDDDGEEDVEEEPDTENAGDGDEDI